MSDRLSVFSVIHVPRKSYEIYAGPDHVRTRGLRLLILKSIGNVTPVREIMAVKKMLVSFTRVRSRCYSKHRRTYKDPYLYTSEKFTTKNARYIISCWIQMYLHL